MDHQHPDTERHPAAASEDPLLALRRSLEDVDDLPLDERARVFEQTHEVVVRELRALELG